MRFCDTVVAEMLPEEVEEEKRFTASTNTADDFDRSVVHPFDEFLQVGISWYLLHFARAKNEIYARMVRETGTELKLYFKF